MELQIAIFTRLYEETNDPWFIKRVIWMKKYGKPKGGDICESKHSA